MKPAGNRGLSSAYVPVWKARGGRANQGPPGPDVAFGVDRQRVPPPGNERTRAERRSALKICIRAPVHSHELRPAGEVSRAQLSFGVAGCRAQPGVHAVRCRRPRRFPPAGCRGRCHGSAALHARGRGMQGDHARVRSDLAPSSRSAGKIARQRVTKGRVNLITAV